MGGKGRESIWEMCIFLSHFPRLYSFHYLCPLFCRLQCLCGRSSLESLWPAIDLKKTNKQKTLRCLVLSYSSELRGEISLAVPLTAEDWTTEMVLPPLTERRIGSPSISWQRSVIQTPRYLQQGSNREIVFWFLSSHLSFRHCSVFYLLWWQISLGFGCHLYPLPVAWSVLRAVLTYNVTEKHGLMRI